MTRTLAALVLLAAGPACAQMKDTPPAPTPTADECAVWARELSFADSVAQHDAKAFADHVHAGAVFNAKSPQPLRGREAIVQRWAKIIDGTALKLSWYPTAVVIGGEGDIALSSGPALYESPDPKDAGKASIGGFQSTWHKGADGVWRVLFDDGIEPKPATEADIAAFHAGRKTCPQG